MAANYLRLQPVKGKFLKTSVNGVNYSIYLFDPRTNERGTLVPHADAIAILSQANALATLVPQKDNKGNFVSQLTKTEASELAEKQAVSRAGLKLADNNMPKAENTNVDDTTAKELAKAQAEIATLKEALAASTENTKAEDSTADEDKE